MHPDFRKFLSDEDEKKIVQAIARAERNTSGEIRIHLQRNKKGDVLENAIKTFEKIGMTNTALRNGVLIYIDIDRKTFAVIGDKGIHEKVGSGFWEAVIDILRDYFLKEQYTEGIIEAVTEIGRRLKRYFPYQADDINELPDEISYD
jgi:uncharacterized membrane protein